MVSKFVNLVTVKIAKDQEDDDCDHESDDHGDKKSKKE